MPCCKSIFLTFTAVSTILPTASSAISAPPVIFSLFPYSIFVSYSLSPVYAFPLGYLIAIGPSNPAANSSIFSNSKTFLGAITVILGILLKYDMSNIPWCVSPSLPTSPALSTANITGSLPIQTSWRIWSYALWKNVEYIATTGFMPFEAMPAAKVTACSSAIPTSKNLSGNLSAIRFSPVPDGIAADIATIFSSLSASSTSFLLNT